ncbi:MAG: UDP-N-acetylglucosamine 2-epimerase (non-hydrolyzing) [Ekhidna sp.]|uniref:non-hydrolyzing UDP-N-acetylglucosamine 2-epimerase n=1 Tax=Ekhidna sp. TaxID=2608089 RepID=UPI0032EB468E
MPRITILVGTRPEAIKLIPVYKKLLEEVNFEIRLVSTGQHKEMLQNVFDFFGVSPQVDLGLMTKNQTLSLFTSRAFEEIDKELSKNPADLVIVQGDTTTAMVAAMVGYYHQIDIAHVEAGLRTYNKYSPFPEEVNRRIISSVANIHFAPTEKAREVLEKEGYNNIHVTGNTTIDSLLLTKRIIETNAKTYDLKFKSDLSKKGNVLITGHRRESFGEGFDIICDAIEKLARKYSELQFIYPVHLNPNVKDKVFSKLEEIQNIVLLPPLPYDELVYLMMQSKLILTDSGGIQEEAPSLNIPVVVMRNDTERMEGIEAGCSVLAGVSDGIFDLASEILEDKRLYWKMSQAQNPYGAGDAAKKISIVVKNHLHSL